jgi:hypothetical protein
VEVEAAKVIRIMATMAAIMVETMTTITNPKQPTD